MKLELLPVSKLLPYKSRAWIVSCTVVFSVPPTAAEMNNKCMEASSGRTSSGPAELSVTGVEGSRDNSQRRVLRDRLTWNRHRLVSKHTNGGNNENDKMESQNFLEV